MSEERTALLGEHLHVDCPYYGNIDEGAGIATVSRQYLREGAQSWIGVHPIDALGWSLPPMRRAAMEAIQQAAIVAAPIVSGDALHVAPISTGSGYAPRIAPRSRASCAPSTAPCAT